MKNVSEREKPIEGQGAIIIVLCVAIAFAVAASAGHFLSYAIVWDGQGVVARQTV